MNSEWLAYAPIPPKLINGNKWHVFLSYRSVNRGWVLNLYDVLTELGFKVFLDQYVLKPGDSLSRVLEDALEYSQSGVLVWSTAAQDSEWVRNEYDVMVAKATNDKNFHFVPIKVDQVNLPTFAETKIFLDFTDYPDGPNGGVLLRLVHGIVGESLNERAVKFAWEQDEASGIEQAKISAALRNGMTERLMQLFEDRGLPWKTTASLACKTAEALISLGEEDSAIKILSETQTSFPKSVRPKQLEALALARRAVEGDLDKAQIILSELHSSNNLDPETSGIYARTWMDRYRQSGNIMDLRQSRNLYLRAFERSPDDYYCGVNAASKSVMLGEFEEGERLAEKVQELVGTEPILDDYWQTATIAEVFLLRKHFQEAANMYQKAIDYAPTETRSHESTRNQAKTLLDQLTDNFGIIQQVLKPFGHLN